MNEEASEIGLGFFDQRVILRVAQSVECHEAVEHRRKNRRESIATLAHTLGHPLLGPLQRILAEGMDGDAIVDFQERIAPQKKVPPGPEALVFFQGEVGILHPGGIEFMQVQGGGKRARGPVVVQDRQRGNDRAAPRGHFVEVEKEPAGKEKNLGRDGGDIVPWELAEKGEVEATVGIDLRDAAETEDIRPGVSHPGGVWRVASELQREVGFHRSIDLTRATDENIPAAISRLPTTDVVGAFGLENLVHRAPPIHVEDGVRTERGIHQQLTFPMAVLFLDRKKKILRTADASAQGVCAFCGNSDRSLHCHQRFVLRSKTASIPEWPPPAS